MADLFKGFQQAGAFGLTQKPTNLFMGFTESSFGGGTLNLAQTANLVGYFRNNNSITVATGVSSWVDAISGANLAQGTGALQPTLSYLGNTLSNTSKISFASTQFMSAGDVFDIRTNTGWTVQFYMKITPYIGRRTFGKASSTSASPTIAGEYCFSNNGVGFQGQFFDNVSLKTALSSTTIDTNNYYLYSLVIDITNSLLSVYQNEKVICSVAISNTAVDYNNGSAFFLGSSGSNQTIDALEGLVYQVALTQDEVANNVAVLKEKFGV